MGASPASTPPMQLLLSSCASVSLSVNHSSLPLIVEHCSSFLVWLWSRAKAQAPGPLSPFLLRAQAERQGTMPGILPHIRASTTFPLQPRTSWVVRSWLDWGDGVKSFAKNKQDNKPTLMPTEEHNLTLSICKLWCLLPPL